MRILILGGTGEARELAQRLTAAGVPVISSLAGRVSRPALPVGELRIGGFGGPEGLEQYLIKERISTLVDATHPFAATISANAALAAHSARVALVRLVRPGWSDHPDARRWTWVADAAEVVRVGTGARRPFLTTGRQSITRYGAWTDRSVLIRVVDPPDHPLPGAWRMIVDRGPYTLEGELALMRQHRTDLLVSKDSGGPLTTAKLDAARELNIPIMIIRRPSPPLAGFVVQTVSAAMDALIA